MGTFVNLDRGPPELSQQQLLKLVSLALRNPSLFSLAIKFLRQLRNLGGTQLTIIHNLLLSLLSKTSHLSVKILLLLQLLLEKGITLLKLFDPRLPLRPHLLRIIQPKREIGHDRR